MYLLTAKPSGSRIALVLASGDTEVTAELLDLQPGVVVANLVAAWAEAHGCRKFELAIVVDGEETTAPGSRPVYDHEAWDQGTWSFPNSVIPIEIDPEEVFD